MTLRVIVNTPYVNTPNPTSSVWWDAAVGAADSAPDAVKRLLAGVDAVEVSESEAQDIKDWAAEIFGWVDRPDDEKPLLFQLAGDAQFVKTEWP